MPEENSIIKILRQSPVFRGLPDKLFQRQDVGLDFLHLKEKQFLFTQGEVSDAMYVLVEGELHILSEKNLLHKLVPFQCVGEISVLGNDNRSADAIATKPSKLIVIPKTTLDVWIDNSEVLLQRMVAIARKRLRSNQLSKLLPGLFGTHERDLLNCIVRYLKWQHLQSGDYLFKQDDEADSMYILISGRLQVITQRQDGEPSLAYIYAGECVGEMAVLSNTVRNASVRAQRNCDLVEIKQDSLDQILQIYPQLNRYFVNEVILKFSREKFNYKAHNNKNITLLPIQDGLDVTGFCEQLQRAISHYESCQLVNASKVDSLCGIKQISSVKQHSAQSIRLDCWLDEYEDHAGFNIYVGNYSSDAWTQRCVQRADTILLLADPGLNVSLISPIEDKLLNSNQVTTIAEKVLILLNDENQQQPHPANIWLKNRELSNHYNVRNNHQPDFYRLARFLTNNAIGLVMGGGGARGHAHFGVWLALKNAGIPIDMFGGTSMGASIAAVCAMGWDRDSLAKFNSRTIKEAPFKQYTLPLISLVNSKLMNALYRESYGDLCIEDLWVKYFCVSANLSRSEIMIHRAGTLWHALRASSALPGVLTPQIHQQELLVDGGLINNLPGDIMRQHCRYVIVSDVSTNEDFTYPEKMIPSPWKVLLHRYSPFRKPLEVPGIIDILMRSVLLSSKQKSNQVKAEADLYLNPPVGEFNMMDFTVMERLIDIGIMHTESVLAENDNWKKFTN